MGVGLRGVTVKCGVSDFLQIALATKPLGVLWFAAVFNLILITPIVGEWVPLGCRRWYRWVGSW